MSLVNNKFSSLERIFANLPNLVKIDLDTNLIEIIENKNFLNSPNLSHVLLQSNLIKEVELNTFDHLKNLEMLNIQNNPLNSRIALDLPPQALFDYSTLINESNEKDLYDLITRYYTNTRFVDQILDSEKASDKIIAFLRLLGYGSNS